MSAGKEIKILTLLAIDTVFFLIEAIVGYAVHSLALVADSFHMLNDIFSLIVALWAVRVAKNKGADARYTYGWKRAEILGALINAVFLLALCFTILIEAIQRLISPPEITNPKLILYVGTAGLISNIVGLFLFHDHGHSHGGDPSAHSHSHGHGDIDEESTVGAILPGQVVNSITERSALLRNDSSSSTPYSTEPVVNNDYHAHIEPTQEHEHEHEHTTSGNHDHDHDHSHNTTKPTQKKARSMNMHGVFLHVLGDALGNVGVILTAIFIWKTDFSWKFYSDPVISLVITGIIFSSALPLCKRASRILLQATPTTVSADDVQSEILKVQGVKSVHDFHIWNLTEDIFIASLHIEVDAKPESFILIASEIRAVLHTYGIHSATVQPEFIGKEHIPAEVYQQFTKIASGKYSSRNNSLNNLNGDSTATTDPISAYGGGDDACHVDSAVNCNTKNCLSTSTA